MHRFARPLPAYDFLPYADMRIRVHDIHDDLDDGK